MNRENLNSLNQGVITHRYLTECIPKFIRPHRELLVQTLREEGLLQDTATYFAGLEEHMFYQPPKDKDKALGKMSAFKTQFLGKGIFVVPDEALFECESQLYVDVNTEYTEIAIPSISLVEKYLKATKLDYIVKLVCEVIVLTEDEVKQDTVGTHFIQSDLHPIQFASKLLGSCSRQLASSLLQSRTENTLPPPKFFNSPFSQKQVIQSELILELAEYSIQHEYLSLLLNTELLSEEKKSIYRMVSSEIKKDILKFKDFILNIESELNTELFEPIDNNASVMEFLLSFYPGEERNQTT